VVTSRSELLPALELESALRGARSLATPGKLTSSNITQTAATACRLILSFSFRFIFIPCAIAPRFLSRPNPPSGLQ
jgi:hypothetical protein